MNIQELKTKDPKRFEKEHEKWCEHEPYDDWWDCVYEHAKEDGELIGFNIEEIQFSGFSSQGDGASWTGRIDLAEYIKADKKLLEEPAYNILLVLIENDWGDDNVYVSRGGSNYVHENTMCIGEIETYGWWDVEDVIRGGVYMGAKIRDLFDAMGGWYFLEQFEKDLLDHARDFAQDIYSNLEKEYEYLTSEACFIEHCECNDVEFDDEED